MFATMSYDDFISNVWIICKVDSNKSGIRFTIIIFDMRFNVDYMLSVVFRISIGIDKLAHHFRIFVCLTTLTVSD